MKTIYANSSWSKDDDVGKRISEAANEYVKIGKAIESKQNQLEEAKKTASQIPGDKKGS